MCSVLTDTNGFLLTCVKGWRGGLNGCHATIELTVVGPRVDLWLIKGEAIAVLGDLTRPVVCRRARLLSGLLFFFVPQPLKRRKQQNAARKRCVSLDLSTSRPLLRHRRAEHGSLKNPKKECVRPKTSSTWLRFTKECHPRFPCGHLRGPLTLAVQLYDRRDWSDPKAEKTSLFGPFSSHRCPPFHRQMKSSSRVRPDV
jgi:hypothetical protein